MTVFHLRLEMFVNQLKLWLHTKWLSKLKLLWKFSLWRSPSACLILCESSDICSAFYYDGQTKSCQFGLKGRTILTAPFSQESMSVFVAPGYSINNLNAFTTFQIYHFHPCSSFWGPSPQPIACWFPVLTITGSSQNKSTVKPTYLTWPISFWCQCTLSCFTCTSKMVWSS